MLRAIKLPGNKIYTGKTIEECIDNAKNFGSPPMESIAGWINEEGTFVTEKPSETIIDVITNASIYRKLRELHPMMMASLAKMSPEELSLFNGRMFAERLSYGISFKKRLKSLWDKIVNYKVKL
jgi:hypothetical protein